MPIVTRSSKGSFLTHNELDGNFTFLQSKDINNSGQIKVKYTGVTLVNFTAETTKIFDINAGTPTLSAAPTTTFPAASLTSTYSDLFDSTQGITPTGRLKENPIMGQVNLWRIQGSYSNKAGGNAGELILRLKNPVSLFQFDMPIVMPSGKSSGLFSVSCLTIADSASIPVGSGYILEAETSFTDANYTCEILSITRVSNAIDTTLS